MFGLKKLWLTVSNLMIEIDKLRYDVEALKKPAKKAPAKKAAPKK